MLNRKAFIFCLAILILIVGFAFLWLVQSAEEPVSKEAGEISLQEKQQIEAWVEQNDLNQYGDPKDTVYLGGTPLFDETTGQSADRYEYIVQRNPDRPWKKQ